MSKINKLINHYTVIACSIRIFRHTGGQT